MPRKKQKQILCTVEQHADQIVAYKGLRNHELLSWCQKSVDRTLVAETFNLIDYYIKQTIFLMLVNDLCKCF